MRPLRTLLLLLLSAYLITIFLKPVDIFSSSPIYTDDYAMHFSQCLSARRFLSSSGRNWGYDPFFLAGFPRGALVNADNKAWELKRPSYCEEHIPRPDGTSLIFEVVKIPLIRMLSDESRFLRSPSSGMSAQCAPESMEY